MMNLSRFKNYAEFLAYYRNSENLLAEVTIEVNELEDYISSNEAYLVPPTKEDIAKIDELLSNGEIDIIKYNEDMDYRKRAYIRYLLEEFGYSSLYEIFAEVACDTIRMEKIVSEMFKSDKLTDAAVARINNKRFKKYKLQLSNQL